MIDETPPEIFVDKDYPETRDNRFSLKDKEHRLRYELVPASSVNLIRPADQSPPVGDEVREAVNAFKKLTVLKDFHLGDKSYQEHLETLIRAATQQPECIKEAIGLLEIMHAVCTLAQEKVNINGDRPIDAQSFVDFTKVQQGRLDEVCAKLRGLKIVEG